ncbi:Gfo/Idh/MocA family protein [Hymenobacter profundi]|uniref:Gfo/Idh/MocA family oxidoreductase n=1 Tax=Hymenobacter profundi TaxID=1982110 RepID=A0ABS6X0P4_9BACT|nr:Gfo/Idh/MocA family oxidoreductase [Hymenobacter profundi]MBW3129412.1 Gfo/Idh/MocA family oxidoreductase [Hymenobacter profundi]
MTKKPIGVGIIGASKTSWAAVAHIPALRLIPDFKLVAVSTSNQASAQAAADAFGAAYAFDNAHDLANCPEVDLVVVSVKVPTHRQLVTAALTAGKMVYCEWPLGNGTPEAEELTALAQAKGIRTFVGLQAVARPETRYLQQVLAEGLIGEVLSTSVLGSGMSWGATVNQAGQYLLDPANGATLLTIPVGHLLAAFARVVGDFQHLSATLARRRTQVTLQPENISLPQLTDDQVVVTGVLAQGAVASLHYRSGTTAGLNFHWEINGTKGDIVLSGDSGHYQLAPVSLQYAPSGEALRPLPIPVELVGTEEPAQPVRGLYEAYQAVLNDLRHDTHYAPTFENGLHLHRLLDRITQASAEGRTLNVDLAAQLNN